MKKLDPVLLRKNVLDTIYQDFEKARVGNARIIVAQNGKVLLDECIGYQDPVEQTPLKPNTMFRLASMTKPITGFAFLIGLERGWYKLTDKISDHFPEFKDLYVGKIENGKVIKDHKVSENYYLYNFLSHTSGFMCSTDIDIIQRATFKKEVYTSNKTVVDYCLKNCVLAFDPGTEVSYCTTIPFDVIALLIEKYSGMTYSDFITENIFKPLGIKDITYYPTDEQWERFVVPYDNATGLGFVGANMGKHLFEAYPLSYTAAGCGLSASGEDYFKFAEMLRNRGEHNGVRLVKKETFDLYTTAYVKPELMPVGEPYVWGLSVKLARNDPSLPEGTFGWDGAYGTLMFVDPTNQITGIYMRNSRWFDSHGSGSIGRKFEKNVYASLEK